MKTLIELIEEVNKNRSKKIDKFGFELDSVELTKEGLRVNPIQPKPTWTLKWKNQRVQDSGISGISGFMITDENEMVKFLEEYLKNK